MKIKPSEDVVHEIFGLAKFLKIEFDELVIAKKSDDPHNSRIDTEIAFVRVLAYSNGERRESKRSWKCESKDIPKTLLEIRDKLLSEAEAKVKDARRAAEKLDDELRAAVSLL